MNSCVRASLRACDCKCDCAGHPVAVAVCAARPARRLRAFKWRAGTSSPSSSSVARSAAERLLAAGVENVIWVTADTQREGSEGLFAAVVVVCGYAQGVDEEAEIAERLAKIVGEQVLMAGILGPDSDIVLSVEQTRARVEEVARTLIAYYDKLYDAHVLNNMMRFPTSYTSHFLYFFWPFSQNKLCLLLFF